MNEQEIKKPDKAPRRKPATVRKPTVVRKPAQPKQPAPPKLKLLVTVVDRDKAELYTALLQAFEVNLQMVIGASGTASTETLRMLGLSETEKAVILSVVREDQAGRALRFLEEKFQTIKNGKGIAYTVPMTGTIGVAIYQFLANIRR